ncbi:MAG: hypothetical protein FWC21_05805 [Treponema sp.]|nr:hypothetical protein [Treponema sp.]
MPSIIQFFHPGQEHRYDKKYRDTKPLLKDWNSSDHRRKFLLNEGTYIKNDKKHEGKLLFWGEWEPLSRVELIKPENQSYSPPYGVNPNYLHIPFLPPIDQLRKYHDKGIYQNTDPFIFGNCFIYAICRQKNQSLQELEEGSLIIFGSKVNHRFVIDTVFVIKSKHKYHSLDDVKKMNLGIYPEIATKFIIDKNNQINYPNGLILYKGATFDDQVNGMYSFLPAKIFSGKVIGFPRFFMPENFYYTHYKDYFQRSFIENGMIHEEGMMNFKNNININKNEIFEFWNFLKNEVLKNHVLGVNFSMPEEEKNLNFDYPFTKFNIRNENFISFLNDNKTHSKKC